MLLANLYAALGLNLNISKGIINFTQISRACFGVDRDDEMRGRVFGKRNHRLIKKTERRENKSMHAYTRVPRLLMHVPGRKSDESESFLRDPSGGGKKVSRLALKRMYNFKVL